MKAKLKKYEGVITYCLLSGLCFAIAFTANYLGVKDIATVSSVLGVSFMGGACLLYMFIHGDVIK